MSQPDHEAIVNEIKSAQIAASPELRARVRAIAAQSPAPPPRPVRRELPWRRAFLVLAPAAVAVALAGALTIGLVTSGGSSEKDAALRRQAQPPIPATGPQGSNGAGESNQFSTDTMSPQSAKGGTADAGNLPSTPGRAQLYEAELALKITDLSTTTKRALRLTRDFHGYVRSVEYGSGTESGSAYLVLRVPVGAVQEALVKFSSLGKIVDQHVSITDVQPTVDKRFRQMQGKRDLIAKLQARLESPTLTSTERTELENQLVAGRRALLLLQKQAAALARQTSFATVELDLRQGEKTIVVPHEPSRIGKAFHRSGQILVDEAKVLVYVLVVGAPIFLLVAFMVGGFRIRRRRDESRLLATS